jgi:hypothetical protein
MKKKVVMLVAVLSITLLSFSVVSPVFASELFQGGPGNGGVGNDLENPVGYGNRGTIGTGTGVPLEQSINLDGILEDLIHKSLAAAIGIDIDILTESMENGETFSEIALSLENDPAAINDMIASARAEAIAQAVAEGRLTLEQVDRLASRGNQMPAVNFSEGICDNTGDCLEEGVQQSTMMEYGYRKGYGK